MFNSTVLEVAIGLVFCYASVALMASSVMEGAAGLFKLRSKSLLSGIKLLFNDQEFEGLARNLYNHALVNPKDSGGATLEKHLENAPAYIESKNFANALIDIIQTAPNNFVQLGKDINAIENLQLRQLLRGMHSRAGGSIERFHAEIADWFDTAMERVSCSYKRRSHLICFAIAFMIACLFNIDSFHLFKTLWQHPALVSGLSTHQQDVQSALVGLNSLPIGWEDFSIPTGTTLLLKIGGWLITASSSFFGAPFWFAILKRLTALRVGGSSDGGLGSNGTGRQLAPAGR